MMHMSSRDLRDEVVKAAKKAEQIGLCQYKSGNFSAIDRDKGLVYITPSGMSRDELTPDKLAVLDLEGNIVEAKYKPSMEVAMHLAAYKIRPEALAVAHTHSRYATLFASMGKEILPVSLEAVHYGGTPVKVAEYAMPGTRDLARSIVEPLNTSQVCLLKYHGSLGVGESMEKALLNIIYVEEVAFIYYHMLALGQREFMPEELFRQIKNA